MANEHAGDETTQKTIDPVCGMTVDPERARAAQPPKVAEHAGKTYFFCSNGCVAKFKAEPEKYLNKNAAPDLVQLGMASMQHDSAASAAKSEMAAAATEYTCPMHPEIVRSGPGSCPICGMALEPRTFTAGPA